MIMISNSESSDLPSSLRQFSTTRNSKQRQKPPRPDNNDHLQLRRNEDYSVVVDGDDDNSNNETADDEENLVSSANTFNSIDSVNRHDSQNEQILDNIDDSSLHDDDDIMNDDEDVDTVFHSLTAASTTTSSIHTSHHSHVVVAVVPWWQSLLYTNVLADAEQWTLSCWRCCCCYCYDGCEPCVIVEGVGAIRFIKFVVVTLLSLIIMHTVIRWMGLESKESYTLWDMIQYDLPFILLDCSFFFIVGRLYAKQGVDHIAFVGISWLASCYTSGLTTMRFLQHSVTLYDMHCYWPLALWIFVAILIPLIVTIIVWHVRYVVKQGRFAMKLTEMALTIGFFLLPNATSPHFHFHHWFAGWLLGMHCNLDTWWSQATMAWCWGQYINGIAVYGRDPLLTCGYSYYLSSQALKCPYMHCYYDEQRQQHNISVLPNATTTDDIPPIPAPDWLHCTR